MRIGSIIVAAMAMTISQTPVIAVAGSVQIPTQGLVNVRVKSLVELRFRNVVRQTYDVSCGAAALATLLTYYYGVNIGERAIIDRILSSATDEAKVKIQEDGFSMLELKRMGEQLGFVGSGFRVAEVADLAKLRVPAITLMTIRGYSHFVVIKGISGGEVFIADPAFGNRSRPLEGFGKEWNNAILVFNSPQVKGDNMFTLDPTLRGPEGEVISILDHGLRLITPPQPGEF